MKQILDSGGPPQLFVDAELNLFEAWLYDLEILNEMPSFKKNNKITKYFWFGGLVDSYSKHQQLTFHIGDEMDLMNELPACLEIDVFRRPDTIGIFKKELTDGNK